MSTARWNDESFKQEIRQAYLDHDPTHETNAEILQQLGIDYEVSPNSIRVFLTKEGIYVVKPKTTETESSGSKTTGSKRVPKEQSINQLKELITSKGKEVDTDIVDKLTGKAALYFVEILKG